MFFFTHQAELCFPFFNDLRCSLQIRHCFLSPPQAYFFDESSLFNNIISQIIWALLSTACVTAEPFLFRPRRLFVICNVLFALSWQEYTNLTGLSYIGKMGWVNGPKICFEVFKKWKFCFFVPKLRKIRVKMMKNQRFFD